MYAVCTYSALRSWPYRETRYRLWGFIQFLSGGSVRGTRLALALLGSKAARPDSVRTGLLANVKWAIPDGCTLAPFRSCLGRPVLGFIMI
jgi:hypothetical protein